MNTTANFDLKATDGFDTAEGERPIARHLLSILNAVSSRQKEDVMTAVLTHLRCGYSTDTAVDCAYGVIDDNDLLDKLLGC